MQISLVIPMLYTISHSLGKTQPLYFITDYANIVKLYTYFKPFFFVFRKFMGLILKYQIYQSFAEELISDESDLIKHISENNDRLL